jgi:excisionase family DNA binding protein
MADDPANETFYTTRGAAAALNVSVKTAQLWVEGGILQAWKTPGGHRRISHQSVKKLLDQRRMVEPKPAAVPAPQSELPELLVAEDDPRTCQLYELTIKHWGLPLRLTIARDGFEGLLRIGEHRPDMLVTDLDMPGMNGFQMISSLRAVERYRSLPIVVVSGMSQSEIRDAGGLPDGIAILAKPIPFNQLRAIVESRMFAR